MSATIRTFRVEDGPACGAIRVAALPETFLGRLGASFFADVLSVAARDSKNVALVAEVREEIAGYALATERGPDEFWGALIGSDPFRLLGKATVGVLRRPSLILACGRRLSRLFRRGKQNQNGAVDTKMGEGLEVLGLMTKPAFQGQGVASGLLDGLAREARSRNRNYVFLSTEEDNLRAVAFYQKRGFQVIREESRAGVQEKRFFLEVSK